MRLEIKRLAIPGTGAIAALVMLTLVTAYLRDDAQARIRKSGFIRVGYAVEAPYAFLSSNGDVTGESPELAKTVASRLGIRKVIWRQVEFGSLLDELEAGRIDMIAAGMFITPERAARVSFSHPAFHVHEGLLVLKGNPHHLHSYEQAAQTAPIIIAAISGSVEEALLHKLGLPSQRLMPVPDARTGLAAVESGLAHGLALSGPTVRWMALENKLGRTEPASPFKPTTTTSQGFDGLGAFAFRKEDVLLLKSWNSVLKNYIGSPEHMALIAKFGFTRLEIPNKKDVTPQKAVQR